MTWANEEDLIHGDLPLGDLDTSHYLNAAEDEINVHLGNYYSLPIPTATGHILTVLKTVHSRLASGRLILAQAAGAESEELHAYGQSLVAYAYELLARVGTSIQVPGATSVGVAGEDRSPKVVGGDTTSPWTTYESFVHGKGTTWLDYT